jgi:IS30 family transposase
MRYQHLTKTDRLEISILLNKGYSIREIGRALGKNPSSISREIKNNKVKGKYDPDKANHKAYVRRLYSKYEGMKIAGDIELRNVIEEKIQSHWTPEEIAGWLKQQNNGIAVISAKAFTNIFIVLTGGVYASICHQSGKDQAREDLRNPKNK